MAWFGKVSLGGLQDLAGAVNKISESVKNIEKNFDTALGLEEKPDSEEGSVICYFALASDQLLFFQFILVQPLLLFLFMRVIQLFCSYVVYSGGNSIQVIFCIIIRLYGNVK